MLALFKAQYDTFDISSDMIQSRHKSKCPSTDPLLYPSKLVGLVMLCNDLDIQYLGLNLQIPAAYHFTNVCTDHVIDLDPFYTSLMGERGGADLG